MIEKDLGFYALICDICGNEADEPFDEFMDAVDWKKDSDNGWTSRKDKKGNWEDVCPDCQNKE